MAHHPTTGRRDARTPSPTARARRAGLAITLVLLVAGCAIGAPSERATPPPPTEVPGGGALRPPEAALGGLTDPPDPGVTGALGSWTWAEAGDDAPWLVPSSGGTAKAGSELAGRVRPGPGCRHLDRPVGAARRRRRGRRDRQRSRIRAGRAHGARRRNVEPRGRCPLRTRPAGRVVLAPGGGALSTGYQSRTRNRRRSRGAGLVDRNSCRLSWPAGLRRSRRPPAR